MFINLRNELPYGIFVKAEKIEQKRMLKNVRCNIYCNKESHKGMIIGKQGLMLKKIATQARIEMEHFFNCKVNLSCWVKINVDWRNNSILINLD